MRLKCGSIVAVVGLTGLLATGCGSSTKSSAGANGHGGTTIKIGDITGYTPSEIEANIFAVVASQHPQLGIAKTSFVTTDVPPGWVGLERGDTDVFVEADMPNQSALVQQAKATTTLLGPIYANATEGFFVPAYAVGAGAPAAGLTSILQLNRYRNVFGGTLYDDSPGFISTADNTKRIAAYGLDFKHLSLADSVLVAQIEKAEAKKQPILFFFYHPYWLFARYKFVELQEPNPYHAGCFTSGGTNKCAVPSFSAFVAARKDLQTRAPRFYAFLKQVRISVSTMQGLMYKVSVRNEPLAQVAEQWVAANQATINRWMAAG